MNGKLESYKGKEMRILLPFFDEGILRSELYIMK